MKKVQICPFFMDFFLSFLCMDPCTYTAVGFMIHDSNAIYLRTLQLARLQAHTLTHFFVLLSRTLVLQHVISWHTYGDIHAPGSQLVMI